MKSKKKKKENPLNKSATIYYLYSTLGMIINAIHMTPLNMSHGVLIRTQYIITVELNPVILAPCCNVCVSEAGRW